MPLCNHPQLHGPIRLIMLRKFQHGQTSVFSFGGEIHGEGSGFGV